MSSPKRRQEKKQRRQKRLEKRRRRPPQDAVAVVDQVVADLSRHLAVPEPSRWPGGCDATLARPDLVKLKLAEFATKQQATGRRKLYELKGGLQKGLLYFLPNLDHWAIEEFLWHGLPGDGWQPIEQFLAAANAGLSPGAAEQVRLWKQARIGLFEIGPVVDDTVTLQEWDAVDGKPCGDEFRAIALNVGGVNLFGDSEGMILLTYLAPWAPQENLYCSQGYSVSVRKDKTALVLPYVGLQHPEVVMQPLPWRIGRAAEEEHRRVWRQRDWQGWLAERLQFPFPALVNMPPQGEPQVHTVQRLLSASPQRARDFGIYFDVAFRGDEALVVGATGVTPLDVASTNRRALAEYHAYREWAGPPRAVRDAPTFMTLE